MRNVRWLLLAALAVAPMAEAAQPNGVQRGFGIDVTATAQGFLVGDLIKPAGPTGPPGPIKPTSCDAWLIENDDDADTVWVVFAVVGSSVGQPPVAVADPTDVIPNQTRVKPGQSKSLSGFVNGYLSVIGTGDAHVHFEMTCPNIN